MTKWGLTLLSLLAAATLPAAEEPEPAGPAYRFSGGEKIHLIVPERVGVSVEQLITDDGYLTLPTGGMVNVRGKTMPEAQKIIIEELQKESGARQVTAAIALLAVPPETVVIGGEVKSPQTLTLSGSAPLSLFAALQSAGGIAAEGDPAHVCLVRTGADGSHRAFTCDVTPFGTPGNKALGPALRAGDVVIVPRGDIFILAGEVAHPGPVTRKDAFLGPGEPALLSRVLFATGGTRPSAGKKAILIRTGPDGAKQTMEFDLDEINGSKKPAPPPADANPVAAVAEPAAAPAPEPAPPAPAAAEQTPAPMPAPEAPAAAEQTPAGTPAAEAPAEAPAEAAEPPAPKDPVLQNGDVVLIPGAGTVPILGNVRTPGIYPLPGQSMKLSRLIAMAGGFAQFAKSSSVTVLRAKAPKAPIHVDMNAIMKGEGAAKDLDLEDGDMVFVGERIL